MVLAGAMTFEFVLQFAESLLSEQLLDLQNIKAGTASTCRPSFAKCATFWMQQGLADAGGPDNIRINNDTIALESSVDRSQTPLLFRPANMPTHTFLLDSNFPHCNPSYLWIL